MARPRKCTVFLTEKEAAKLKSVSKSNKISNTIRSRCLILLALDESNGPSPLYSDISKSLGVTAGTITNTLNKYIAGGIELVMAYNRNKNSDNSRRKVDGRAEAQIIQLACSEPPEGHARWTLRLLAKKLEVILDEPIHFDTVGRTLKKTNLDLTE